MQEASGGTGGQQEQGTKRKHEEDDEEEPYDEVQWVSDLLTLRALMSTAEDILCFF